MTAAAATQQVGLRRFEPGVWLFVRLVLGVVWVRSGWGKVGDVGWTAPPAGAAAKGFLNGAIEKSTAGPHPEVPHWYHGLIEDLFLPNADLFASLVAYGELLVGVALIAGLFTRFAALGGVTMNLAFLWAGTTSTNPPLLLLGLSLVFFGHRPGRLGVDGWLFPWLRGRFPAEARRFGRDALFIAALLAGAWLALIASDWTTWLLLAAVAAAVSVGVSSFSRWRTAGSRASGGFSDG